MTSSTASNAGRSTALEDALPETLRIETYAVEGLHCAGCMRKIEKNLTALSAVSSARVNLSKKQVTVTWDSSAMAGQRLTKELNSLGYPAKAIKQNSHKTDKNNQLISAMAVAGFSAANIMLLSVAVWSGGLDGMGTFTRDYFHWIAALIAIPTIAYSGRPFFNSARQALRKRSANMDVPISLAVLLALTLSLFQLVNSREHTYFDAAVVLLFLLLVGRVLDQMVRRRAFDQATNLASLQAVVATRLRSNGSSEEVDVRDLSIGDLLLVRPGDRIAADGMVASGLSDIDLSMVTGESLPETVSTNSHLFAGALNLSGVIRMRVTAVGRSTLLSSIEELMIKAQQGRAHYVRIADKAAEIYVPFVHGAALLAFILAMGLGLGWETSLSRAITLLIITFPCALGLAVPVVQIIISTALFNKSILLKSSDALERLAKIDTIVFDKTGTLTLIEPELTALNPEIDPALFTRAQQLASFSSHPLAKALAKDVKNGGIFSEQIHEFPGQGLQASINGKKARLGSKSFCQTSDVTELLDSSDDGLAEIWYTEEGEESARFAFQQKLRPDAEKAINQLVASGYELVLLSGDKGKAVENVARQLSLEKFHAGQSPREKAAFIRQLKQGGRSVLMVGDGINDAAALMEADVAMSPSTASEINLNTADLLFQNASLMAVPFAIEKARLSSKLIKQNFALAIIYNLIAIPLAFLGFATPLVAAIAMSSSSLLVIINALRGSKSLSQPIRWEQKSSPNMEALPCQ
ncbi:heavy metal translocating P-type ATPase [Alphaproteobacteria bacterium]|nr:heavy metal translocating P-type ATPase [Alphaproteobacteria bacterium]